MKQSKLLTRISTLLLALALLTLPMLLTACGNENADAASDASSAAVSSAASETPEKTVSVTLTVKNAAGEETSYPVTVAEGSNLAAAMKEAGILQDDGIKDGMVYTINGELADYSVDQSYWAFYQDGEYMMTGAEDTILTAGATYSFVHETYTAE